jgi:hypothetical protein
MIIIYSKLIFDLAKNTEKNKKESNMDRENIANRAQE